MVKEVGEERRYEIELLADVSDCRVPTGDVSYEVQVSGGLRYHARMPVTVKAYVNGVFFKERKCTISVHVYDQMLVAARSIYAEQVLGAKDVRIEEREINFRKQQYLRDMAEVQGCVVRRAVREGTVLTKGMLLAPVMVKSGMPVTIIKRTNGIVVKSEGIALQRGRAGDAIRVRNSVSRKVLRAKVIDEATVEVL